MIYISEIEAYKDKHHNIKVANECVSKEEYDAFMGNFHVLGEYQQLKELHDLCLDENIELSKFLSKENLNSLLRTNEVECLKALKTGNKLLLNYCTAIRILYDKTRSYLFRERKEALEKFDSLCSNFYDSMFSYRFFWRLRNYILHNKMPFTIIEAYVEKDCNMYLDRNELIKWNGWSGVREDLEKLNDNRIALQPLLSDIGSSMYAIYMTGLYYMAPDIILLFDKIKEFRKQYGVKYFNFIECDSVENLKKGNFKIREIPWRQMSECIDELNNHPSVNIIKTED